MKNISWLLTIGVALFGFFQSSFAGDIPYTDIKVSDPYYYPVKDLYDGGIITDNGDHLFRPNDLMNRDFFVSLAVGIGCHQCETPTIPDLIKYQISPFIDLPKTNRYFYCIAYAKDNDIAQGYILDENNQSKCENGQQYMSSPFCADNNISRIEAAAILLRRAKLWNDTENAKNFDRSNPIPDTTTYWYGYAKKAIEIGIIVQKNDKTIGQDTRITRGEFAIMAAKILAYTQCQKLNTNNTITVDILIQNSNNETINETSFPQGSNNQLSTITGTGDWDKKWTLTNPQTKETYTGTGNTFPLKNLGCGTWINTVELIDKKTGEIKSSASNTITIECNNQPQKYPISLELSVSKLQGSMGTPVDFIPTVKGGSGALRYSWDYGDGTTSGINGNTSHTYTSNGTYTVTLTVTDALGNSARSHVVVTIRGEPDSDGDGALDSNDRCPQIFAKTLDGCPIIPVFVPPTDNTNSNINNSSSLIDARIGIKNGNNEFTTKNSYIFGEIFSLVPVVSTGSWNYNWRGINIKTGIEVSGTGPAFPGSKFSIGDWKITLDVVDPKNAKIIASPTITIHIRDTNTPDTDIVPCVMIIANPAIADINSDILSTPTVCPSANTLEYTWNNGDGTTSYGTGINTHQYTIPGVYRVTLTVKDLKTGKIGESSVLINIKSSTTTSNGATTSTGIKNICIENRRKNQGLLIGSPNCTQCPCGNSIAIDSPLRSCDIVFPTVLSPTLDSVYARGGFYLIP